MSGNIIPWPTRVPGRPYLWVLDLDTGQPAPRCATHKTYTDRLGVCEVCVAGWRKSLGADPNSWLECTDCGFPLHPSVEADGHDLCPSCSTPEEQAEHASAKHSAAFAVESR